jgi:hypothetical protein
MNISLQPDDGQAAKQIAEPPSIGEASVRNRRRLLVASCAGGSESHVFGRRTEFDHGNTSAERLHRGSPSPAVWRVLARCDLALRTHSVISSALSYLGAVFLYSAALSTAAPLLASAQTQATEAHIPTTAARAKSFVQSIGVNQHLRWHGTPYNNATRELDELQYLGVTLVRDDAPGTLLSSYQMLASAGIRFDFLTSPVKQDLRNTLPADIASIAALAQFRPGSVLSVEGPNELNGQEVFLHGASSTNPATGAAIMQAVARAVRGNATLAAQGVKVVNVSITNGIGGWQDYLAGLGNLAASVDYANWHVYFQNGEQPQSRVTSMYQYASQSAPGRPVVITEAGYFCAFEDKSGWGGVDEATQAKNTLNLLADTFKAGVKQTFLYELMEGVANPSTTDIENTFGLFRADGTPKPVATAIHNLASILADPAGNALTFTNGTLDYSISNLPTTGHSLLLEKANGVFELLVWNEAPNWNSTTKSAIPAAPTNIEVNLGAIYRYIKAFDPLQGSTSIRTVTNASTVKLALTDRLLIVEISTHSSAPSQPSAVQSTVRAP